MSTATAVEPASAMEAPTTVDRACTMEASTTVNYTAPGVSSSIAVSVTANVAASIAPAWATPTSAPPIPRPTVVSAVSPAPVVPGSGADKDSACKPLWAIEAVRRASIRVIGIVPVRAYRRTAHISWPGVRLIGIAPVGIPLIGWALIGWTLVRVTSIGLTLGRNPDCFQPQLPRRPAPASTQAATSALPATPSISCSAYKPPRLQSPNFYQHRTPSMVWFWAACHR